MYIYEKDGLYFAIYIIYFSNKVNNKKRFCYILFLWINKTFWILDHKQWKSINNLFKEKNKRCIKEIKKIILYS